MVTLEDIQRGIAQVKETSWGYGPKEIHMNLESAKSLTDSYGDLSMLLEPKVVIVDIKPVVLVDIAGHFHKVGS